MREGGWVARASVACGAFGCVWCWNRIGEKGKNKGLKMVERNPRLDRAASSLCSGVG